MPTARVACALVLLVGCLLAPSDGLGSSTRSCGASGDLEAGVEIRIQDPARFVGYCMRLGGDGMQKPVLAKVPGNGTLRFGLPGAGWFGADVSVEDPDDRWCRHVARATFDHNGSGLLTVAAQTFRECA